MAAKIKFRDEQGNEFAIPDDRIKSVTVRSEDGSEHEVEGHLARAKVLEQEGDVEGHSVRIKLDDGQEVEGHLGKVRFLDDDGNEQDVEGHFVRWSDLRLKRDVEPLGNALNRLVRER